MAQRGRIHKNGTSWYLTYWQPIIENGKPARKQVVKKLAPVCDQYRTEAKVRPLAEEILGPINAGTQRPESTQTVGEFLEGYLAHCKTTLRPSTCKGYGDMLKLAKPHLGNVTLREFRTPEANKLMRAATSDKQRAHTTHRALKSFLSGAFKYAKRTGVVNDNPIRDVEIPRGKSAKKREAYTLDEISAMLAVLPEPARTIVLTAALTGLRRSELQGIRWEDLTEDADRLIVNRGVWNGKINETKTLASHDSIPLVSLVMKALAVHRKHTPDGFIFQTVKGTPMWIENVYRRDIEPAFAESKTPIRWRGWHPFRHGVGTTLRDLGVDIKTISEILRHTNTKMTLDFYVKPSAEVQHNAMAKMEKALNKAVRRAERKTA